MGSAIALSDPQRFVGLVLSAHPSAGSRPQRVGRWLEAELLDIVRRGEATPDDVVHSPTWRRHLLELLCSDLTLGVRLTDGVDGRLTMPVTVLARAAAEVARQPPTVGWGASARIRTMPGGHFYLLAKENVSAVASEVVEAFLRARSTTAAAG